MDQKSVIRATKDYVKDYFSDKESGHNWWHVERVWKNAMYIYSKEKRGDLFVIEIAALLHDIGDDKIDKETDGLKTVKLFLGNAGVDIGIINKVIMIMSNISFRDSYNSDYERTDELDIVQDADRLDAIGAIGIARAFNYGGSRNNEIYVPDQSPGSFTTREEYTDSRTSTINHFYEKLLLLKDMMNTTTGREMAEERHKYMENFLKQFYREWDWKKAKGKRLKVKG